MGAERPLPRQLARLSGRRRRPRHRGGARRCTASAARDFLPDRTLVLDARRSRGRARGRATRDGSDRIGGRAADYHPQVDAGFRADRREEPERVRLIDAIGRRRARSPRACSTRSRICCRDRRPGPRRRAVRAAPGIAAAAPCLAARRAQGRRQGQLRRDAALRVLADAAGPPSSCPGLTFPTIIRSPGCRGRQPSRPARLERLREREDRQASPATSASTRSAASALFDAHAVDVAVARGRDRRVDDLEAVGRQRPAQDARGAAGQHPVLPRQPCAGPAAADDPLALPAAALSPLDDDAMTSVLRSAAARRSEAERERIIAMAGGSAGRALALPSSTSPRSRTRRWRSCGRAIRPTRAAPRSPELGTQGAGRRYAAFLDLAPVADRRARRAASAGAALRARAELMGRRASSSPSRRACRSIPRRPCSSWRDPRLGRRSRFLEALGRRR